MAGKKNPFDLKNLRPGLTAAVVIFGMPEAFEMLREFLGDSVEPGKLRKEMERIDKNQKLKRDTAQGISSLILKKQLEQLMSIHMN